VRRPAGVGSGPRHGDFNHSKIVNRPFTGNTVNYNNRNFQMGHQAYQPAYYRHPGYHGYWNGNRGFGVGAGTGYRWGSNLGYGAGYGPGWGWGLGSGYSYGSGFQVNRYRPFGWGLGGWGLGALMYNSGYLAYSNPYYVGVGTSVYNYSQPIPVSYNATIAVAASDADSADEVLNNAVAAFKQDDYDLALDITNKGIAQYADDAVLHEFRALVLFARRDYQQAAATIHSVLAVGPGWDWTTLSSMYSSVATYTAQSRELEAYTKANPQDAASRFLLAYHYMSCGHSDAAARQLRQVVTIQPNDRVASDLLKLVSAPQAEEPSEATEPPTPRSPDQPRRPEAKPIDPATLVGAWKAARGNDSEFRLTLSKDAKFTWNFAQKNQEAQSFGGTYTVEGNVLALERKDGGSLLAEVTPQGSERFTFKLLGAPDDDAGLDFSR